MSSGVAKVLIKMELSQPPGLISDTQSTVMLSKCLLDQHDRLDHICPLSYKLN